MTEPKTGRSLAVIVNEEVAKAAYEAAKAEGHYALGDWLRSLIDLALTAHAEGKPLTNRRTSHVHAG